jgi:hypothetical protein
MTVFFSNKNEQYFFSAIMTSKSADGINVSTQSTSFQLQRLKLANSLLKAPLLRLQICQSPLLNLLHLSANLLLIGGIIENLALLVNAGHGLLQLLGGFGDLGVDVDAVFDVEEDDGGGGDGEDDAAGGAGV